MTNIAFFGHDVADSAVRRRVKAMTHDGFTVTGFMMHRRDSSPPNWKNVDLGAARDRAMIARIKSIFVGARIASKHEDFKTADLLYARNLDMLAAAFLAKKFAGLSTPVIYECLDIHALMIRSDPIGKILRWLEGRLLRRSRGLVTSSPGFLKNYFEKYHKDRYSAHLVENRLASGSDYGERPQSPKPGEAGKLRLGWVGMLRCERSLDLLCDLADRFPETLEVKLHGIHAKTEIPIFEPLIDKRPNMSFAGRYKSPEDLADIYAEIDVVWAGDFMDAGYNSVWLLPNRIYEGGYYGVPAIAPKGTETGNWIEQRASGFTPDEPLKDKLFDLFSQLFECRKPLDQASQALIDLDENTFVEPVGVVASIVESALAHS